MPVTIKTAAIEYKSPTTGEYIGVDAIETGSGSGVADLSSIAPSYDDLIFPVAKGQLCYYENVLYEAKQNIPTSEVWVASHWEARTISEVLNEIDNTAIVKDSSAKGYYHKGIVKKATFYPNEYTQNIPVRYTEGENLLDYFGYTVGTEGSVLKTKDGRFLKVENTSTGGLTLFNATNASILEMLAGKTVNICIYLKKAQPWANSSYFFIYNGSSTLRQVNFSNGGSQLIGWNVLSNITIPANSTRLMAKFNSLSGSSFSEGDFFWIGIYESTPVVTETLVTTDPFDIEFSNMSEIDTMMHQSTAEIIIPTKQYVDEHTPDIIGYWNDNIFAMPESFGAKGDGVTDDSVAIANCVSYAVSSGKPVRGFGIYKTSSPIVLSAEYMDVFFHAINYSGNGSAVELNHMDIHFEFHTITSTGIGIKFGHTPTTPKRFGRRCIVIGNFLRCDGDCIYIEPGTMYNTIEVRYVVSNNGNCITNQLPTENEVNAGEYVIRDGSFSCPNGYVTHNLKAFKMYSPTIEANCKYGFFNPIQAVIIGARHREQIDAMKLRIFNSGSQNNGALLIFTDPPNGDGLISTKYTSPDSLTWFSIDVSAISGYDPIPNGDSSTDIWVHMAYNGLDLGCPIRGVDNASRKVIGSKMYFIGNNKVYVPEERMKITMTLAECDFSFIDSSDEEDIVSASNVIPFLGTDYVINVAHSNIYFCASHGAVGYNDLTFTQANGNTCTVYDKIGNVIFDGTSLGNGTWRLKCIVNHDSCGRLGYSTPWWCYDGTNEQWVVEKVSDSESLGNNNYRLTL